MLLRPLLPTSPACAWHPVISPLLQLPLQDGRPPVLLASANAHYEVIIQLMQAGALEQAPKKVRLNPLLCRWDPLRIAPVEGVCLGGQIRWASLHLIG
jgi:hypothetical protein